MGEAGVIKKIIEATLEGMLDAKLTEHPGYIKYSPAGKNSGNSHNCKTNKTLKNENSKLDIIVPRDSKRYICSNRWEKNMNRLSSKRMA